ncbi:MAG TPA: hybrid sensor histidine kinase/response regulator, partial [Pseudoduganella sp.]
AAVSQACGGRPPPPSRTPQPEPAGPGQGQDLAPSAGMVSEDSSRDEAAPGARASWCAVCRAMNVQCDRIDLPED